MFGALVAGIALAALSLAAWLWLLLRRGGFWRVAPLLEERPGAEPAGGWPSVAVVIPARNEAAALPETLPSILDQDYPGVVRVFLVDDASSDGTASVAAKLIRNFEAEQRATVVSGKPLPPGWTGKVWSMAQGVDAATSDFEPDFVLLTDADIRSESTVLRQLVAAALLDRRDLVSVMAKLVADEGWERLLIPAFVYFFAKLYPFAWVADPKHATAGAAGGCILVRRAALEQAGGMASLSGAVIDDCTLAARIKSGGGRLWLGYSPDVVSVRGYGGLRGVWNMVARSAFSQLRYSWLLLGGTVVGMAVLYLVPPFAAVLGAFAAGLTGSHLLGAVFAALGLCAWGLMAGSFLAMARFYGKPPAWSLALPLAGALYTAMTVSSGWRHLRGRGAAWKGRTYG